ncbi:MAG: hypothetical protein K6C09_09185 [Oscillospiraceae bacterium]|nr:hypothetical protein [Oscillospiraceae bacterium]
MLKKYAFHDADHRGTIDRVYYTIKTAEGDEIEKYANVYLPWGYDREDAGRRYDILYLMHGGHGNPDSWLDSCPFKNMLDCCFAEKAAEPFIVVFPSYYRHVPVTVNPAHMENERQLTIDFTAETVSDLLPAVESHVRGWADSTDEAGLRASRRHRAFGGFSMGAVTTWFEFLRNLPYFSTFLPLSGDCWAVESLGGNTRPFETANELARAVENSGMSGDGFRIFAATGSEDSAFDNTAVQIEEMKRFPVFQFSEDPAAGNFHYEVAQGATHCYDCVLNYTYSFLPYLFG